MPVNYRRPTPREKAMLEKSREKRRMGIEGEKDMFSKFSTTMAKAARDEQKMGQKMYESVPEEAREYEAYEQAGYKAGGMVNVRGQGAARKTKGCKIT